MTKQKINKSDYTDRKGVVHSSIGENIRSDNNQLSADYLNSMNDEQRAIFPFFPFNGEWVLITDTIINGSHTADLFHVAGGNDNLILDKRVKFVMIIKNDLTQDKAVSYYPSIRAFQDDYYLITRFLSSVSTADDGKEIKMLCYVESE